MPTINTARIKAQALEILQDIPDDKAASVIEALEGLRALYKSGEKTTAQKESANIAMGIFSKYANPDLVPLEKEAWGMVAQEKHAIS